MKRFLYDVAVIGSGGAGLASASAAAEEGARVAVVNKGYTPHTGATIMAPGSFAAVGEAWKSPNDSKECHFRDTLAGGQYLNKQDLVKAMVEGAAEAAEKMERMGALFQRTENGTSYALRTDGGHSYPRSLYLGNHIGRELCGTLTGELIKRQVPIYENVFILEILKDQNGVRGVLGLDMDTLEPLLFECASLVLATGGAGYLYENSDNPPDLTGDGLALALRLGLSLMDMEFVQVYPLGFLSPPSIKGAEAAYINCVRLFNAKGERFMERWNPEKIEMATRDTLIAAIMQEIQEGRGSPSGGVFAGFQHLTPEVMEREMPDLLETYKSIGFDPHREMLEVAPTVHFTMGGVAVDENWGTPLPGLYGAGEVCGGVHGANRLSQNALTEALVSGFTAGRNAAQHALKQQKMAFSLPPSCCQGIENHISVLQKRKEGVDVEEYRRQVRKIMWEKTGILRREESLTEALTALKKLQDLPMRLEVKDSPLHVIQSFENRNMVLVGLAMTASALCRRESRGAHNRTDWPEMDNKNYLKNFYVSLRNQEIMTDCRDVELKYMEPGC
ncbi:MAG: FAD-binding protein [Synergistaceae bacterium]|jgi:succinate dehydrogenase/fumarate reductase flavoprotein subunit|nr:FAD-binding protein [Synergistaceae bacterium]